MSITVTVNNDRKVDYGVRRVEWKNIWTKKWGDHSKNKQNMRTKTVWQVLDKNTFLKTKQNSKNQNTKKIRQHYIAVNSEVVG